MSRNQLYLSECGRYICRVAPNKNSWGNFEVWLADGSIHWECDDRIRTWDDAKLPLHPLPYGVGGYSAEKTGQKSGSFTLNLLHCDMTGFKLAISWGAESNTPLRANNSYTLDALSGAWLQGGFKISCTDGNNGTDCGNINSELFWQQ